MFECFNFKCVFCIQNTVDHTADQCPLFDRVFNRSFVVGKPLSAYSAKRPDDCRRSRDPDCNNGVPTSRPKETRTRTVAKEANVDAGQHRPISLRFSAVSRGLPRRKPSVTWSGEKFDVRSIAPTRLEWPLWRHFFRTTLALQERRTHGEMWKRFVPRTRVSSVYAVRRTDGRLK